MGAPSEAFSADVPAGDVISQAPAPGTSVAVGSTVAYVVSLGVEPIAVPDLAGVPPPRPSRPSPRPASWALPARPSAPTCAAGDVISQAPAPGTSVAVGSTVDYVVSLGVETIAVPDLAGPADEAEQALAEARLVGAPSEAFSADVPAGDVISQAPAAGHQRGRRLDRRLRREPGRRDQSPCPTSPRPADEAEQALAEARLVGAPSEAFSADVPAGDVISQDPAAGHQRAPSAPPSTTS